MMILGDCILYEQISRSHVIAIVLVWLVTAAGFMFMTTWQINHRYEKPMRQFAKATRKVADGDFSVYVKPLHTTEKMNYLDAMFLDFNKMVEELGSIETLKTDFFSNVSHEFKTPLAVIQSRNHMISAVSSVSVRWDLKMPGSKKGSHLWLRWRMRQRSTQMKP